MKIRNYIFTSAIILSVTNSAFALDPDSLYSQILTAYIREGKVNYSLLCNDNRFDEYIQQLSITNPDTIEDENERLAFWINAYNAYTLKVVCDHYPVNSITEIGTGGLVIGHILGTTVWHNKFIIINHKKMSLNNIEHEIIRPKFHEPRIHFALVCAATSCPPLRPEAYDGELLNKQLDEQGHLFLNNPKLNSFDLEKKVAHLSKIFDWYGDDFGKSEEEILLAISQYLPAEIAKSIREHPSDWEVDYLPYDWDLNDRRNSNGTRK